MTRFLLVLVLGLFVQNAMAQRFVKTFDTVDQMLAANPRDIHTNAIALGRLVSGDGGGGSFYYDSASTIATNAGMAFKPNNSGGRWIRLWSGDPINVLWFGAQPTKDVGGTLTPGNAFDNSVPINQAIAWARTPSYGPTDVRATVLIPEGDFWISKTITNRYRVNVKGVGTVFTDSEITSHATNLAGLTGGGTRLRLADNANCSMMVWDLADASQRYSFSFPDDSLSLAATITIASPGVITVTNHGLTIGRKVGFTTTGALPTGLAASTIYYVASVPTTNTLTVAATLGGAAINTSGTQSGTHLLVKDPTERYVAGHTIEGLNFFGNSANQSRFDCHIIDLRNAWNVRLFNCNLRNPSGYLIFGIENNTFDIVDCYGTGGTTKSKGVFLWSCADGFMSQSKFGGVSGPALWVGGPGGWQQQYTGNFLFNAFNGKLLISSISNDEITFSGSHDFETGMPLEFWAPPGSTLPAVTRFPTLSTDSWVFWAIKTASNKIKIAYSLPDAMAGSAMGLTAGTGTYYAWHGPGAGAYLSAGANNNVIAHNRCDQNLDAGIWLNLATENSVANNLANLNGFDSLTGLAAAGPSAGIYLENGAKNNVILGNSMMDWTTTYAQTYGLWIDANCGKNFVGENAYKANPSQIATLISTTGNTTETSVVQTPSGTTLYADATGSPLTIARSDNLNQWQFQLSGVTNVMRIRNAYANNTAINISSPTTDVSVNFGSVASPLAPRSVFLTGELASTASGNDVAAGDFFITTSLGTGTNATGGAFRIYTPTTNLTTGNVVQASSEKFNVLREGGITIRTLTAAPSYGLLDGAVYPNSTDGLFYGRLAGAWHTLSNPNRIGVSTITSDAAATFTFSPLASRWNQLLTAPITATRTVTLSTTLAQVGTTATFIRSSAATGAFNWSIGGLINLTAGTWATVVYDGSSWVLGPNSTGGGGSVSGPISPDSVTLLGTAGAGFVSFPTQSSAPSTPASGFVEYADSSGRVTWKRASDGFARTINSTLTADRIYTWPNANTTLPIVSQQLTLSGPTAARTVTLPDANFTAARTDAAQTFSGLQSFAGGAETQNGTSGTSIDIYKTYSGGGANYERLRIDGGVRTASEFSIGTAQSGTGVARALSIYGGGGLWLQSDSGNVTLNAASSIALRTASATRWNIGANIVPNSALSGTIGASGTEVASVFSGTASIVSGGAANAAPVTVTGSWFSGGTATTTKPQVLVEPTGTTSTGWSTSGTGLGINAASGFTGNLVDAQLAGTSKFKVSSAGDATMGKVNGVTVTAGSGTPSVTVNGSATVSGINTGDQQIGGASGWRFYEEFNWNSAGSGGAGWLQTASGGANSMAASPAANRPGIFQMSTSSSTTGNPNLMDNGSSLFLGGGPLTMEWSARITTGLPSTADDYDVWMGLGDTQTSSSQTDGVYFLFDRGVSAVNWQFVTAKAGTRTTTDTGIAANGSGTWQKFRFEVNAAATSVVAYIDGVACATNTVNLPDTSSNLCGKMFGLLKQGGTTGTTAEILQLDYVFLSQDFTTSR